MPTILVTDDDTDYRASIIELIELWGYAVISANNGAEALQQIETHRPDLILCDIDMPVLDGLTVLQRVKGNPVTAAIPFVLVTGRSDVDTAQRAANLKADGFILKPMDIEQLEQRIQTLLQQPNGENN